jgi:hypothetical protein
VRRVFWLAWAAVFGLAFLLILATKFTALFSNHGIPFAWLVLTAVGCVACLKSARQARRARSVIR